MIEGVKISELNEVTKLGSACCFPVLSRGATQRITFAELVNNILPYIENEIGGVTEEELKQIREELLKHENEINELISKGESIDDALSQITFKINGQDRTIIEYTSVVQELQRVYEQATISGGVVDSELNQNSINPVQNKVIAALIPNTASETNKLADKNFVNSSIGTNTANYISNEGEPFTSVEDLENYAGTVTNNDYAFVTGTDSEGNVYFDRYKASVTVDGVTWGKEYRLNNSSFTAEQWAAIESGITEELVNTIQTVIGNTSIFVATTCNTASETQKKEITIGNITLIAGALLGITFTNGNSFGDCLAEEPTYPTLSVNGGTEHPICDSRGNTVGIGAWNDGDYIELRFTGTKFIIVNSNVRQVVDDEYILLADGSKKSIDYYENGSYTIDNESMVSGYVSSSSKSLFLGIVLKKRVPIGKTITLKGIKANLRSNSTQYDSGSFSIKISGGYIGTSADTQSITGGFDFYNAANNGRSITPSQGNMYLIRLARTSAWYNGHWNDMNNYTITGSVMSISFTISD